MANTGSRKQITFDLHQESLKQHYPHQESPQNAQYYKKAYRDIQRFMTANGFEHRQYSVYTSIDRLTTLDVVGLMERLAEHFPWLSQCINEIDVTNIGVQHSLKQTLENAAKTFDIQLDEVSMETDLDLAVELPNPKVFKTAREHKKAHSHER
jgi:virulence-associated protein VapD